MKKKTTKEKVSEVKAGLEVIGVKIGSKTPAIYKGLGGTFASFTDSCLRKQTLPGFHETGLIAGAEPYPDKRGKAKFIIDVKSEK